MGREVVFEEVIIVGDEFFEVAGFVVTSSISIDVAMDVVDESIGAVSFLSLQYLLE